MPVEALARAEQLTRSADFFMVVGSTLLVQPASLMPVYAKEGGAFLAIVTLSETPYDRVCDLLISAKAGEVLPEVARRVSEYAAFGSGS